MSQSKEEKVSPRMAECLIRDSTEGGIDNVNRYPQSIFTDSTEGRITNVKGYPQSIFMDPSKLKTFKCTICHAICKNAVGAVDTDDIGLYCELCVQHDSAHSIEYQKMPFARRSIANARVKCPNASKCRWEGKLKDRDNHAQTKCAFKPVPCHFARVGCKYVTTKIDMRKHENSRDSMAKHLKLAVESFGSLQAEMQNKDKKIELLETRIKKKEESIELLQREMKEKGESISSLKTEMQAFKLEMRNETEKKEKKLPSKTQISNVKPQRITLTVHEHKGHALNNDDRYHPSNLLKSDVSWYESKYNSTFSSGESDWITFKVEGDKLYTNITQFRIRNNDGLQGVSLMRISVNRDNKEWTDIAGDIKVEKGIWNKAIKKREWQTFPINHLDGFKFIKVCFLENHGEIGENYSKFLINELEFIGK